MNIDTNELDHIAGLLADARMEPLKERIRRLERENAYVYGNSISSVDTESTFRRGQVFTDSSSNVSSVTPLWL